MPQLEQEYAGRGYGDFKKDVADAVVEVFGPIKERTQELLADPAELDRILTRSAERASEARGREARRGLRPGRPVPAPAMTPVVLRTPRLVLDQPGEGDVDRVTEYCQDAVLQRFTTIPVPYARSDAEHFLLELVPRWWEDDVERTWAIREADCPTPRCSA